jgi:hypothetical protein
VTHRTRRVLRVIVGLFVPHTAVLLARQLAPRVRPGSTFDSSMPQPDGGREVRPFSYEQAVAVLMSRGLDERAIRMGSIQARSMRLAGDLIARNAPPRPLRALHVGNYVGLSLAALSDILVKHDPRSLVVSVDPNIPHLGVDDPQSHVLALLSHFGLQNNNVVICGYTLQKSLGNNGVVSADGYDPVANFAGELACENTLANFEHLGQRFDLALVDGNHDADYLRRELEVLVRLIDDGGLLILDDVSHVYKAIRKLFKEVAADSAWPLEKIANDDRLGILRKTAATA